MKERQFQRPGGGSLTWYEAGQGRPLILLHGWAVSAAAFQELAGLLAGNYRVLVPDLPGHGKSSPAGRNDLAGLSDVLTDWLSSLAAGPYALVGWSLGGMLSLQMASDGKLPVERLSLIGSTPKFTAGDGWSFGLPVAQVRAMARNLRRQFEATLAEFFSLTFAGESLSIDRLRMIRNFAVRASSLPDQDVAFELLNVLAEQDQRDILSKIQVPAMVLHGELDRISPAGAGRAMAAMLPLGEYVPFAGIGHAPFLSKPHDVAVRLLEFC
ncbi:MAG: alpha/beta fold hydrolase [Deltaproteobacteria bacterium]|jgi:pimeloyl-[acyl-carrier protein] methyl ester esterase|nr:alpha/beta fold hydrolase [Deltaproteobacteria bacterium]MDH4006632.1 alpha/beta fold hydrolase [Desulfuromonadales bacterium]